MLPRTMEELYDFIRWDPARAVMTAAHRGGPQAGESENSLTTFARAVERGATFCEIDVRRTTDGVYWLHHDNTLERTTTGSGAAVDCSLADLQALELRDMVGEPTGERILLLDEMIEWARGRALLYVDVKPPLSYAEVQRYLQERDAEHLSVTLTYSIRDTLAVHAASPQAVIYAMTPEERRVRELLACGIPHRQLIASIQEHTPTDMYDLLHDHCISVDYPGWAGTDRRAVEHGPAAYRPAIESGCDIVNTDQVTLVHRAAEMYG